jgi:hypothetical protein
VWLLFKIIRHDFSEFRRRNLCKALRRKGWSNLCLNSAFLRGKDLINLKEVGNVMFFYTIQDLSFIPYSRSHLFHIPFVNFFILHHFFYIYRHDLLPIFRFMRVFLSIPCPLISNLCCYCYSKIGSNSSGLRHHWLISVRVDYSCTTLIRMYMTLCMTSVTAHRH